MQNRKNRLSRAERMQLKAFICLLGGLLCLILLVGKLVGMLIHNSEEKLPEEVVMPVVRILKNVWIMEAGADGLQIFAQGRESSYDWGAEVLTQAEQHPGNDGQEMTDQAERAWYETLREQVADVTLTDGLVTEIALKAEKISGKVLGCDGNSIELEGYGRLALAEDCQGYRLYDRLSMCTLQDMRYGYADADFCMAEGKICAILLARQEAMQKIRVLIRTADYEGELHTVPVVTADCAFRVLFTRDGEEREEVYPSGEELRFSYDSPFFGADRVVIVPEVLTGKLYLRGVTRGQRNPAYRGRFELLRTEDGIAVINELPLEEYLYSVVPSEMPADYPLEALKAQAVCARTYAYGYMLYAAYPQYGAHVDDSTAYQVYNNIQEQESTTTAVKETFGQLLVTEEGVPAETFYYSTSCGVGSDAGVWKTAAAPTLTYLQAKEIGKPESDGSEASGAEALAEKLREEEAFAAFIRTKDESHFEAENRWYRWNYEVKQLDRKKLLERLQRRYAVNSSLVLTLEDGEYVSREIRSLGEIRDIYVEKRGAGGVADELILEAADITCKVISEYNIRYVLNDGESLIRRQDGSEVSCPTLLPSGFFVIAVGRERDFVVGYTLTGGGFGHGVGMSQNAAGEMADAGWSAAEILQFFYEGCSIEEL